MSETYTTRTLLKTIREGLLELGYSENLLQENYGFTDMFAQDQTFCSVELGVFAQDPPSYRSACFGVVIPQYYDSAEAIAKYRSLGAPQIFALHPEAEEVRCWKMLAHGDPILIDSIPAHKLRNTIYAHKSDWNPESILRAKAIRFTSEPVQLDFFDMGLIPMLEGIVYKKLDRLLNDVIASCEVVYQEHHEEALDYEGLFRLIFRLIAAKLLGDRQYPGNWLSTSSEEVIKLVEEFYFQHTPPEVVLHDALVQETAWRKIRTAFSFRNLSVEGLAYVYENTLITPEARKKFGVHATPPEIAEYIVQNLPLKELPYEEWRIFEPFCGHAPFLTAALGRLRTLLPLNMPAQQRHEYFIRMLSGMEIDSFACEVARNSLILADYPHPNGWSITCNNFFASEELNKYLEWAQVVICNPPYEDFDMEERQLNRSIISTNKAVEALRRVLTRAPKMLGFVLPRVFINGQSYRQIKHQIEDLYNNVTVVELPPIFNFSETETVLLIAHGKRTSNPQWFSISVEKKDFQQFISTGQPTTRVQIPFNLVQSESGDVLWYSRLHTIWTELASLPKLESVADIHRGIEYRASLRRDKDMLISNTPRDGFAKGLRNSKGELEPYIARSSMYLNMSPSLMLYEAYKLPWSVPKVIANASRKRTDRWLIAGAIDEQGLVCTQRFHGIWPTSSLPLEVISAVLNGPVANAFLSAHRTSRDNQVRALRQIPIPEFRKSQIHLIISLVRKYISYRKQWLDQPEYTTYFEARCRGIVRQIDAEVLSAYNLSMQLEQELIEYFDGYKRSGPVSLAQVKASPANRLYTTIMKVEGVRNEGDERIIDMIVISWNPHEVVHFPIFLFPRNLWDKLERNVRLLAKVNIGVKNAQELLFEDIELVSETKLNDRFA